MGHAGELMCTFFHRFCCSRTFRKCLCCS